MFLDCRAMTMLTVWEHQEYINSFYILYLDYMGAIQILIWLNFTIFATHDENLKKISGMVPEIFDVFCFHAAQTKLCGNFQHFSSDAAQFIEFEYDSHSP